MLGLNPGLFRQWHWQSDVLATGQIIIHRFFGFVEIINLKVSACLYKSLYNSEYQYRKPLQQISSGVQMAAYD
jgi:hypothetical protein